MENINKKIIARLFKLLLIREYSEKELRTKLRTSFPNEYEAIDEAIAEFKKLNYISDSRYAEMIFRHYVNNGYGPKKILYEASLKGVSHEQIESLISEYEVDWDKNAQELIHRKFKDLDFSDEKNKRKVAGFLARRGFESETIYKMISRLSDDYM